MFCSIIKQTVHSLSQAFLGLSFLSGFELNIGKFYLKTSFQSKTTKTQKASLKKHHKKLFQPRQFHLIFSFLGVRYHGHLGQVLVDLQLHFWQTNYLSEQFHPASLSEAANEDCACRRSRLPPGPSSARGCCVSASDAMSSTQKSQNFWFP